MIPRLSCTGVLLFGDEQVLSGDFSISHDLNQSNGLIAKFVASEDEAVGFDGRMNSSDGPDIERNLALKGATRDGQAVSIERLLIGNRNLSRDGEGPLRTVLTLLPRASLLVGAEPPLVGQVKFFIPNITFGGMACSRKADGGFRRDSVLIETQMHGQSVQFRLQQLESYEDSIRKLAESTCSDWTAQLEVSSLGETGLALDQAKILADDFLLLLSFALSSRVMWVALETDEAYPSHREVRHGTAMNLKAFPSSVMGDGNLVPGRQGFARHPLTEFLGSALAAYKARSLDERQAIAAAIVLMCESIERFFSPAAVTLVGRAFEILCKRFLGSSERAYLSGNSKTEAGLISALESGMTTFAGDWRLFDRIPAEEWFARLDGHVSNVLRRPFKLQMHSLADQWLTKTGNSYDSTWINQFVDARNSAAHYGPITQKEADAWIKGITLLARVLLKILGYAGPYVDFWGEGERISEWSVLQ